MGGGIRGPGPTVVITLPWDVVIVWVRVPGLIGRMVVARAAHVIVVGVDVVGSHFRLIRAAADKPGSGERAGQHKPDGA